MSGTYAEQATLGSDNSFIAKVGVAMISKAVEVYYSTTAQDYRRLSQAKTILDSGAGDAGRIAKLAIAASQTIREAAPAVPSDANTQTAVNTVLEALLK